MESYKTKPSLPSLSTPSRLHGPRYSTCIEVIRCQIRYQITFIFLKLGTLSLIERVPRNARDPSNASIHSPRIPIPGAYDVASFCPWVKASAGNHWLLNSVKVLGSFLRFLGFDWGRDGGWGGRRVPGEVAGRAQYVGTKRTTANFWRARQASRTVAIREGVSCCSFQRWRTRAVKVVH